MFKASSLYEWIKANNDLVRFFGTRYRYIYKQHMNNTTGDRVKALSNYYGEGLHAARESKVFIEDGIPSVEFWDNGKLITVRAYPDNTLQDAEYAAEDYVLGALKL